MKPLGGYLLHFRGCSFIFCFIVYILLSYFLYKVEAVNTKPTEEAKSSQSSSQKEHFEWQHHDHILLCTSVTHCIPCLKNESKEEYCIPTKLRQQLLCREESAKSGPEQTFYKSCLAKEDISGSSSFYMFEGFVLALLFGACFAVIRRKRKLAQIQWEKIARQVGSPSKTFPQF